MSDDDGVFFSVNTGGTRRGEVEPVEQIPRVLSSDDKRVQITVRGSRARVGWWIALITVEDDTRPYLGPYKTKAEAVTAGAEWIDGYETGANS